MVTVLRRATGLISAVAVAGLAATALGACGSTAAAPQPVAVACTMSMSTGDQGLAGLGHVGIVLVITNKSTHRCTLYGVPTVVPITSSGTHGAAAAQTSEGYLGGSYPSVNQNNVLVLEPGAAASTVVEGSDVPSASSAPAPCAAYVAILVTVQVSQGKSGIAGVTERLEAPLPGCTRLQVHPLVSGTSGHWTPPPALGSG